MIKETELRWDRFAASSRCFGAAASLGVALQSQLVTLIPECRSILARNRSLDSLGVNRQGVEIPG
jgi:hypothetical protein